MALGFLDGEDFREDNDLFALLARAGVIDSFLEDAVFEQLVELPLDDVSKFDSARVLAQLVHVMTELEVMPFDKTQLPPELDGAL